MGKDRIQGVGTWSLDGNIGKTFRISESKSLQVRVDATNVMNHPAPGGPALGLATVNGAGNDFGAITTKSGNRSFQGQLRFSF
jgi:hypothetical protein